MLLDDIPVTIRAPEEALQAGIAYLTEDRKRSGSSSTCPAATNINLGVIGRDARLGGIRDGPGHRRASEAFERCAFARPTRRSRRQPVRRQPAEGTAVALAGYQPEGPDPGRADARRRCRREDRDLPDHRRPRDARDRDRRHLQRAAGDHRRLRPGAGDARGPDRGRGRRTGRHSNHPGTQENIMAYCAGVAA